MSENNEKTESVKDKQLGKASDEDGYNIAKLIRLGNRELERQLNDKKTTGFR